MWVWFFAPACQPGQEGRPPEINGVLAIVDTEAGRIVAEIDEGGVTGHEVAVTLDNKFAIVPMYGTGGVGNPGTDGTQISVIDLAARKVVTMVDLGEPSRPHHSVVGPDGMVYITNEINYAISILDPKTITIAGTIPTGQPEPHDVAISHDGRRVYSVNVYAGTVSVMDAQERTLLDIIPVVTDAFGPYARGSSFRKMLVQRIHISPDDTMVFTTDMRKPVVVVIDTATNQVKTRISLSKQGLATTPSPDGKYLLATAADQIEVIDLATMKIVHTIDVPGNAQEIVFRPDGQMAYVSCSPARKIVVIRTSDWSVEKLIDTGNYPDGLAWWPGGK